MVYIFFVQSGCMITFGSEISIMQSVADLKEKIKEKCNIPLDQQVLLINGGESLDTQKNLCSYMAGTDTNPIYLFSTNYDISKIDILKNLNYNDSELLQKLSASVSLPVCLLTVKTRTIIAQEFFEAAKSHSEFCENMVHDQHLQQQGWSAVIANLEDIVTEFRKRWECFLKMYEDFIADRESYEGFLNSFESDKSLLQKIPVIDSLIENQKQILVENSLPESTNSSTSQIAPLASKELSLYEWISSDSRDSLDDMYDLCISNLKKFETEIMPSIRIQVSDTLQCAEKPERKEIEGLGKRLFDLGDLVRKIKKYVEYQSDMAQSFLQNQTSVSNLKDTSILPDLCSTHVQQLELIRACHIRLMEDRSRIIKAKYELSKSLCARIAWVQTVEEKIWELDNYLVYFHDQLQRLQKHLEVFQQLHLAPILYMNAVVEVVRRKSFSQMFLMWASDLSYQQLSIHNEEVTRRKEFSSQFEGHFLNALFPGISDIPPAFATKAPSIFDSKLPNIVVEDVEKLKKELPEFTDNLNLPDMDRIINFFMETSVKKNQDKIDDGAPNVEEELIQVESDDVGLLASNLDKNSLKISSDTNLLVSSVPVLPITLKDDKGCESETDTEEFEKVGQSPLELNFPQGVSEAVRVTEKIDVSTISEDTLHISRAEHENLKSTFLNLSSMAKIMTANLRSDVNNIKEQFLSESNILSKNCEDLSKSWDTLLVQVDKNKQEIVESMKRENEQIQEEYKSNLAKKDKFIKKLEEDKRAMEDRIQDSCKQVISLEEALTKNNEDSAIKIDELLKELNLKDVEKEKCLKEMSEHLKLEHKAEIDNIKSRFKFMTMEKSPSLTSLMEKEKCGDFSSLPSHTNLLVQMTENFQLDKENAIAEERKRWEKILEDKIKELNKKFEIEKALLSEDVAKRLSEDNDKLINILSERERNLTLEVVKYKTTIQQLTENEEELNPEISREIEHLKQENQELKENISKLLRTSEIHKASISDSVESLDQTLIADLSRSDIVGKPKNLKLSSCKLGDTVIIFWDSLYGNFKILQESKFDYFLDTNSFSKLGLKVIEGKPNKSYCFGIIADKVLVESNKDDNRFRIPKGQKFFLIKAKATVEHKDLTLSTYTQRDIETNAEKGIEIVQETEKVIPKVIEKQQAEDSGIINPRLDQGAAKIEQIDRLEEDKFLSLESNPEESENVLVEDFWEKEKLYKFEIMKYKIAVQQLSDSLIKSRASDEEVEILKLDNEKLQDELDKLKSEKNALVCLSSVSLCEGKLDATTSPLASSYSPPISDLSRSEIISTNRSSSSRLNIDSCKIGDVVLLLWDQTHENFKVLQESKHTYFLHSDYLEKLGLTITDGIPNKTYCTGEVVDKEYCQTRKSENRYKVPKGTKFFRVKVKPLASIHRDSKEWSSHSAYVAKGATSYLMGFSQNSSFDPVIEEIPPAPCNSETLPQIIFDSELKSEDEKISRFEDSGIEEATIAIADSDRCENEVLQKSGNKKSTNWFGAMFRSMFNK